MQGRWMCAAWLLLATVSDLAAADAVSVRVSPAVAQEPAQITVRVFVEPNPDNRALEVVTESTGFFRKSYRQLDGDRASRTSVFQYRGLPAGDYDVRAVLIDQEGSRQATANAKVKISAENNGHAKDAYPQQNTGRPNPRIQGLQNGHRPSLSAQ